MMPSSQRMTPKPKKVATLAAASETLVENSLTTTHGKAQGIPAKKAVEVNIFTGANRERQASVFVAFAGPSVMAHDAVMKGVSGKMLTHILDSTRGTLPIDAILKAVGVSARTVQRIKTDPVKLLDARTTDGIYRLVSVRAMAEDVLGSAETANEWLITEAMGLEFRKPIDLVSTSPGAEAVKIHLQRMKFGVYA